MMTDRPQTPHIIGVDLDNTLISYDELIYRCAVDASLIPATTRRHKKTIRDLIRQLPDGEHRWIQLQAYIYGEGIVGAEPFEGALEFLQECRRRGLQTCIVSHKTEHCVLDGKQINLRDHALDWLARNGLFEADRIGLDRSRVFFESTRDAKIDRIRMFGCTHFIDDLEEVLVHPDFPAAVERLLFDPYTENGGAGSTKVFHTWKTIRDHLLGDGRNDGISECA